MMDILEFTRIFKEKIRTAIVLVLIGVLVGGVAYFVLPPIYESGATFMVLESKLIRRTLEGKDLDIDTYLNFVDNRSIYRSVYDELDVQSRFDMDFEEFTRSFEVTSVEDTAIIDLVVTFEDPSVAYNVARSIGERALELNRQVIEQEVTVGRRFAENEVKTARIKLTESKQNLDAFLEQHNVSELALEIDGLRNRIVLEETGGYSGYPMVEITLYADKGIPMSGALLTEPFPSIAALEDDMNQLGSTLDGAKADNVKQRLAAELVTVKSRLQRKRSALNMLKTRLTELEGQYYPLKTRYSELLSEFDAAQKGYAEIYAQGLESKLEIVGKTKEMTIIDRPVKPDQKVFPKLIWMLIGGFFLGILSVFAYIMMVGFSRKLTDA